MLRLPALALLVTIGCAPAGPLAPVDAPAPPAPREAPQPDAPQPDAPQPDAPQPDAPQPDAPQPVASPLESSRPQAPRNVILFIADGFGPASATLGRGVKGAPLSFDPYLVGSVETSATARREAHTAEASSGRRGGSAPVASSRVTDSAASATAYACGLKTYNGAIGVTPEGAPCRTVLEAAEARGLATGLVATSRITHATPASFAAHVPQRAQEAEIAAQMTTSGVDVLFGGGRPFFTARDDGRDLGAEWRAAGATVALDRAGYDALDGVPAVALLADGHLAYEIDRDATDQPSLAEMTRKAIELLANSPDGRENGYFLMIEASRIDHAGHGNDPIGHAHDILAYDAAVEAALEIAERDGSTLVVATADHETGGLSLGRDGLYAWDPEPLRRATASFEGLRQRIAAGEDPAEAVREALGLEALPEGAAVAIRGAVAAQDDTTIRGLLDELVSEPAGIGWTTGGHTAVDVGLYAAGPGAERFAGAMPNDALGRALFEVLGLER